MADPLSILASIIAIVQISGKVISICYDYRSGVKKAPRDLARITDEVISLRDVLERLIRIIDEDNANNGIRLSTVEMLNKPGGPLPRITAQLEELEVKLKPANGWRAVGKALTWPLREGDANKTLDVIRRIKETLSLALLTDQTTLTLKIHDSTQNIKGNVDALMRTVEIGERAKNYYFILEWLAAPDQSSYFHATLKKRHPKTGHWFLNGTVLADWKATPDSLLWLHGIPGCGKTVLCSAITDHVTKQCSSDESVATVYYFFNFSNAREHSLISLLCSIISQLANRTAEIPRSLVNFYYHKNQKYLASHHPASILMELVQEIITEFSQVYIILDALDECNNCDEILRFLDVTLDWKSGKLHWLVSSRPQRDIEEHMVNRSTAQLSLRGSHLDGDIHLFILDRLQNDPKLKRLSKEVKVEVERTLIERAQGMFQWVACQIHALSKCSRLSALQNALKSLPKTLDETYTRILAKINEDDCQDALNVLKLLSFSIRPVRLDEVAEALSIDWEASEGPFFSSSFQLLDTEDILVMCSSLVTVSRVIIKDRENPSGREVKEIRLAHFSVKEFLISERIRNSSVSHFAILDQTAHAYISQCCIVYLLQFEVDLNEEMLGQFPLAKYAARYWIDHVQISKQGESNETIQRLALKLLQPNRLPYVNWCRLFDPDKPWNDEGLVDSCTAVSPLYYTSVSGFHWLSSLILERGDDPNAEGGIYGNPLQAAAFKGHESIVRLLLREGAKINLRSGFMGNALVAAVQGGHESIVNLLLEKGADVNASRFGLSNALQEAAAMGNPKITQLLLDYGAKVNEINRKSGKGLPLEEAVNRGYDDITTQLLPKANLRSLNAAIRASSRRGDWNICEALLNRGADVNLSLCHAAGGGFENIVQKLIERNANVNGVVGFPSNNPLIAAAIAGHESVVQQLLASGADGSQSTPSYVNALQAAAKFGRTSIAQLLLDAHVDVNAHGKRGTALEGAAMSGHLDTVMLLLDHGADPNLKGEYGSALYYAADSGRLEIVQELLKRGADVNKPGGIRGTAIQAAAEENHPFIVQYLMERGAEVNTNNESGSVLQSAACNGNDALVRLLLSAGAHIECQDGHNGSPLRRAIDNGRLDTIKLLIEEGADVNRHSGSMGSRSKSPLTCSVGRGDKNSVRFLLENGASVNDQDDAGFTAIHHAARAGHDELLAVLVDEFGADLQLRLINGSLGIHSAARYGAERCLGFFLNHGLEVDSQNFEGRTPLHFAAEAGEKGAVQFLLNNGADRELAESKTRMTALDFVELHLRTTHWSREGEQERWEEIARILRV